MGDLSALGQFRKDPTWEPEEEPSAPQVTWAGRMLAFDQTLSNTGWVAIGRSEQTQDYGWVKAKGLFKTDPEEGHAGSLHRAGLVHDWAKGLIASIKPGLIVHESPPPGGGRSGAMMARPESSLLAASSIRIAAGESQLISGVAVPVMMIGAQAAKRRLTGSQKATKREVRVALDKLVPDWTRDKPQNEHITDAMALAIVALERLTNEVRH